MEEWRQILVLEEEKNSKIIMYKFNVVSSTRR